MTALIIPFTIFGCFALIIVFLAIAGVNGFIKTFQRAQSMPSWLSTQGRITESYVHDYVDTDDGGRTLMYTATVSYEYKVDGKFYTSNSISPAGSSSSNMKRFANDTVEKYPEGTLVEVIYNPDNPNEAFLERDGNWLPLLGTAVVAVVSIGLIGFCVFNVALAIIEGYTPIAP